MSMDDLYLKFMKENNFLIPKIPSQDYMYHEPTVMNRKARVLRKHNQQISKRSRRVNRR